jgi:hypothetical protein
MKNTAPHIQEIEFRMMTDEQYDRFISELADYLCGMSCGTAVDVVMNYVKRPDCSKRQLHRLIEELQSLYKTLK